jgi:hypothetical protein
MNDIHKANLYGQLLNEHTRLHNQINEIKGQNNELTKELLHQIQKMELQQRKIMNDINRLLS